MVCVGLVTKAMNFSALNFRSSDSLAGIASPAPPVGQPGAPPGPVGRADTPKSNLAVSEIPARKPVDVTVEARMPVANSLMTSLPTAAQRFRERGARTEEP